MTARSKELVRPIPNSWWLKKRVYTMFIARELTSLAVAGYVVFLLFLIYRAQTPAAFEILFARLSSPISVVLHVLALGGLLYHAVTWINLTPKVMVVWLGEKKVPGALIAGGHYFAWIAISALVAWLVLGG
jgi:fumarate reductase subunit C